MGRDVAVTGFDDIPAAEHVTPPLTSVHQPLETIGQRLMEMLLEMLHNPPVETKQVLIKPRLVIRESSGG